MVRRRKDTNTIPGMAPPPAAEPKSAVPQSVSAKKKAAPDAPPEPKAPQESTVTPPTPAPAAAPKDAPKEEGAAPKAAAEAAPKGKAKAKAAASAPGGGEPATATATAAPKTKAKAQAKAEANGATSAPAAEAGSAPVAGAKAKGKAKAEPKAAAAPPPAPEPTPAADDGMETVKKPRRRKKAQEMSALEVEEMTQAGAASGGGVSHEEKEESQRVRAEHDRHHQDLVSIIVKEIQSVPELSPSAQVLKEVVEQRRRLEEVVKQLDATLRDAKCPRPKQPDPAKILEQMKELRQCQTDELSFSADAKEEMLAGKRQELSKAHRWESYLKFQEDMNKLREKVQKRIAANDAQEKSVRSDNDKKRLAGRVASSKGVKPEEIDEGSIVSTVVDLSQDVTAVSFLYKSRFEKQYGVVIDRPDGPKGMGKGAGQDLRPPRSFVVHGVGGETAACVAALRALDFSERKVMNVTSKQAAAIMGSQQANARKLEKDFKGVFINSDKGQVTIYGPTKEVKACHEQLQKNLVHEDAGKESPTRTGGAGGGERPAQTSAPPPLIRVDNDKARAMIGANGKNVQKLEADTGTLIKVNLARREEDGNDDEAIATIRVTGDKEKVEKARAAIDSFMKNLATCLVEAPADVVARLYDGAWAASKGASKGKGGGKAPTSKFGELRETSGLTVVRKTKGVLLLGEKADVDKWKVVLKECVEEASVAPLTIKVNNEQARLWSQERCESLKESTGARVQLIRRGKGGENSILEVTGSQEDKDKAQAEIEKAHDALGYSETIEGVLPAATKALTLKGASKLRDIERKLDVAIVVDRKAQEIKVMGKKEAVEEARAELETAIALAGSVVTKLVDIEWEEGGIVIGKQGVTVQSIRHSTGIEDLQVETEGNKKRVMVRGSPEAVESALKMVQEVLEKARNTEESGGKGESRPKGKGKGKGKGDAEGKGEGKSEGKTGAGERSEGEGEAASDRDDADGKRPSKGKGKGEKGKGGGEKGSGTGTATAPAGGDWAASKRAKQEPVDVDCEALFPTLGGGAGAVRKPAGGSAWGSGRAADDELPPEVAAEQVEAQADEAEGDGPAAAADGEAEAGDR